MKKLICLLIISNLILASCAFVPIKMEGTQRGEVSPLGIFIITAIQLTSTPLNWAARDFVTDAASKDLCSKLTENNYVPIAINPFLAVDDVFKKTFFSYYIDEKKVAQVASQYDCNSVLIVYLAFSGDEVKLSQDIILYRKCSANVWIVNTKTKKIIKESHIQYVQFKDNTNGKIEPAEVYKKLIGFLATQFLSFVD